VAEPSQVNWPGKSGKRYTYTVFPLDQAWNDVPANYIFAKLTDRGWSPVYFGESERLKTRHISHEKELCAKRNGATHIHAHKSSAQKQERLDEETDLRNNFPNTPCNLQ
jgi:hypothetical protein